MCLFPLVFLQKTSWLWVKTRNQGLKPAVPGRFSFDPYLVPIFPRSTSPHVALAKVMSQSLTLKTTEKRQTKRTHRISTTWLARLCASGPDFLADLFADVFGTCFADGALGGRHRRFAQARYQVLTLRHSLSRSASRQAPKLKFVVGWVFGASRSAPGDQLPPSALGESTRQMVKEKSWGGSK